MKLIARICLCFQKHYTTCSRKRTTADWKWHLTRLGISDDGRRFVLYFEIAIRDPNSNMIIYHEFAKPIISLYWGDVNSFEPIEIAVLHDDVYTLTILHENGAEIRDDEIGWNLLHMAYSSEPTYSSESVPWDCIIYLRKFLTISNENIMYCGLFDEIAQPPPCDDRLQDVEYLKRILKRYEE